MLFFQVSRQAQSLPEDSEQVNVMQTRIGHVHFRYRVPPGSSSAFTLTTLENIARQQIAEACDRSLETIFENDATVYVLRKVTSRVAVLSKRETGDTHLAEQWGRNLSRAVVRTIVNSGDDENLVRFEDQAEFVSCFLTRLAIGDAWDHWYFGAFANYVPRQWQLALKLQF